MNKQNVLLAILCGMLAGIVTAGLMGKIPTDHLDVTVHAQ